MASTHPAPETGFEAPERPGCPKDYPRFTTASDTHAHELYHDIMGEQEVESFLEAADIYDVEQKRWSVPKNVSLVDALYSILLSVVERFVKPSEPGVKRHIFNIQGYPEC